MTNESHKELADRIKQVLINDKAKFGSMNAGQMITHCADQFRMMFGEIEGLVREQVDINELREKSARGETVQTVKGLDQVAGEGTKPGDFQEDKITLIKFLERFTETDNNYEFSFHPFFGNIPRTNWNRLVIYHLNHHLSQFGR